MKIILKIVNPVLIALIIVGVVYIYFLYHDVPEPGWFKNKEWETEEDIIQRNVTQNAPNTAIIAGQYVADQYGQHQNQYNRQYQFQNPNGFRQTAAGRENTAQPPGIMPANILQEEQRYYQGMYNEQYQFQNPNGFRQMAAGNRNTVQQPVKLSHKILHEGHWIGLEVIPLISTIARANNIPNNVSGVLIDEVTLLAAEVGLIAGDVITAVNGYSIPDLNSFKLATRQVANSREAIVSIYRSGRYRDIMVYGPEALGVAQMEAAPMILATDRSPHSYYGACDRCHSISRTTVNTGQLAKDQGDVLTKVAPFIKMGINPPHEERGRCMNCHKII